MIDKVVFVFINCTKMHFFINGQSLTTITVLHTFNRKCESFVEYELFLFL